MNGSGKPHVLGIDAANIRAGGGLTHLIEVLRVARPGAHGFSRVVIWATPSTLRAIEDREWLVKRDSPALRGGTLRRTLWQAFQLSRAARAEGCDVLLIPGGSFVGSFRPFVAICQNLLPFESGEARRYGWSTMRLKLAVLKFVQSSTFRRADGLVTLSNYSRRLLIGSVQPGTTLETVIPHGVHDRFMRARRPQRPLGSYTNERPYRFLYVSIVDEYKHQWNVALAVAELRAAGLPVAIDLVGPAYAPALIRLRRVLAKVDPEEKVIRYVGPMPHNEVENCYAQADALVFASSCEAFALILLEAMASALPIACSQRSSMPEVVGDAGVYFDPERPESIHSALLEMLNVPADREQMSRRAVERARLMSWEQTADATFAFCAEVVSAVSPTQ